MQPWLCLLRRLDFQEIHEATKLVLSSEPSFSFCFVCFVCFVVLFLRAAKGFNPAERREPRSERSHDWIRVLVSCLSLFVRFRVGWWFQVFSAWELEPRTHTKSHEQSKSAKQEPWSTAGMQLLMLRRLLAGKPNHETPETRNEHLPNIQITRTHTK